MDRREWQREQTYAIEGGQRAANVIQELAVSLQEAKERIAYLEQQLKAKRNSNK